jgi:hypothetical protein
MSVPGNHYVRARGKDLLHGILLELEHQCLLVLELHDRVVRPERCDRVDHTVQPHAGNGHIPDRASVRKGEHTRHVLATALKVQNLGAEVERAHGKCGGGRIRSFGIEFALKLVISGGVR